MGSREGGREAWGEAGGLAASPSVSSVYPTANVPLWLSCLLRF